MSKSQNNTGFWVVIGIAVVGGVGYWAYNKYVKDKVDKANSIMNIFK